jgi:3-deoxy-D-manno-octulosonate 8-phosphate phosphatase (KDO 8-P phosphatase)
VFDVDGVLTDGKVALIPPDGMIRTMNTRDGFALQYAIKKNYNICIITGGTSEMVRTRLEYLGITRIYLRASNKMECFNDYLAQTGIHPSRIAYMGDDLPDYHVMNQVALPCCPSDAATEIRQISRYISPLKGGDGCVRDLIEQTLRCRGDWFDPDNLEW